LIYRGFLAFGILWILLDIILNLMRLVSLQLLDKGVFIQGLLIHNANLSEEETCVMYVLHNYEFFKYIYIYIYFFLLIGLLTLSKSSSCGFSLCSLLCLGSYSLTCSIFLWWWLIFLRAS